LFDERGWAARLNVPRRDFGAGMTTAEVDPVDGSAKDAIT
jgi:hypothetical protein